MIHYTSLSCHIQYDTNLNISFKKLQQTLTRCQIVQIESFTFNLLYFLSLS